LYHTTKLILDQTKNVEWGHVVQYTLDANNKESYSVGTRHNINTKKFHTVNDESEWVIGFFLNSKMSNFSSISLREVTRTS